MSEAVLTIRVWNKERDLPEDLSEALAPHLEHVARQCEQGYVAGEIVDERFDGGWWEIK